MAENNVMKKDSIIKAAVGAVSGFAAGLLGSGGGIFVVEGLERAGTGEKQAHATSLAVILPISALSAAMYISGGYVQFPQTLYLCGGAVAGGLVGAFFLGRVKVKLLNRIFTLLILASGVRLLF